MAESQVLQMIYDVKDEVLRTQLKKEALEDLARVIQRLPTIHGEFMTFGDNIVQWYNDGYAITIHWQDMPMPTVL